MCRGHRPSLFAAFTASGLWFRSQSTRSLRPDWTASCSGRSPRMFLIHRSPPWLANSLSVSHWPLAAPQCVGLYHIRIKVICVLSVTIINLALTKLNNPIVPHTEQICNQTPDFFCHALHQGCKSTKLPSWTNFWRFFGQLR